MKTSEVRNKVEELIEVLVDTEHFITFLATDWMQPMKERPGLGTRPSITGDNGRVTPDSQDRTNT